MNQVDLGMNFWSLNQQRMIARNVQEVPWENDKGNVKYVKVLENYTSHIHFITHNTNNYIRNYFTCNQGCPCTSQLFGGRKEDLMLPAVILVVGHRLDEELIVLANIVRQDQERFCKKMFKKLLDV